MKKSSKKINKITKHRISDYVVDDSEIHNIKKIQ